ncbi:MAG TPA: dihydrolipoamide acetyltransferase family protein [Solirubrobacteraceae bacterium]
MSEIVMPRLSDSMEEGTIIRWLKQPGEQVERGDELVEIETDKATMTYESDIGGVLEILAQEGDTLPVGSPIANLGDGAAADGGGGGRTPESTTGAVVAPVEDAAAVPPAAPVAGERLKASPVARRIARERGVDLGSLRGSGPGGRIVKADVENAGAGAPAPAAAPPPAATAPVPQPVVTGEAATGKGEVATTELTRTQSLIARRMAESRATVPAFTLRTTIDMSACVALRAGLKASGAPVVPSFNDLVVKAAAIALAEHPKANGAYRDARFEHYSRVNVGVAVAAEGTLVVPTVFDADRKGLAQIASETRVLAERVRSGEITPPELSGGTFTVSNLGMFGVRSFEAVINPPQAAILAVGALEPRPVVRDGAVVIADQMDVELACDHRILYGAEAAQFLARIRQILQAPLALAL